MKFTEWHTSQGTIVHVSKLWEDELVTGDRYIVGPYGFLNYLNNDGVILADRGFFVNLNWCRSMPG